MGNASQADIQKLRVALAAAVSRADLVTAEAAQVKAINADLEARNALLELQNEKMRRALYGQRSERSRHLLDQMELTFEEYEASASEDEALAILAAAKTSVAPFERQRPARKPLPAHLPRERIVIAAPSSCPCCGSSNLSKLGEDITETPEVIPRQWKVIQTVREKFSCRSCQTITQPPAPFHVTPRGLFGPSFLAMMLFEKFGAHQPLNRQRDRYAREGVDLSFSTLAHQVGACAAAMQPLYRLIEAHVLAHNASMATTRPFPCSRATRPILGGSGPMSGMIDRLEGRHRQRRSSITPAIGGANMPPVTFMIMAGSCGPTPMPVTTRCSVPVGRQHH
jgi:transposase